MAPVPVLGYEDTWSLPYEVKKGMIESFKLRVGGPLEESEDWEDDELPPSIEELKGVKKAKQRKSREEGEEPVFYQSLKKPELWMELIHTSGHTDGCRRLVVVYNSGDGAVLEACLALHA